MKRSPGKNWYLGKFAGHEILGRQFSCQPEDLEKIQVVLGRIYALDENSTKWDTSQIATIMGSITELCPEFVRELSGGDTVEFLEGTRSAALGNNNLEPWHIAQN